MGRKLRDGWEFDKTSTPPARLSFFKSKIKFKIDMNVRRSTGTFKDVGSKKFSLCTNLTPTEAIGFSEEKLNSLKNCSV